MNFTSLYFFIFLPITCFLYRILPHRFRWMFLLFSSCFFYACHDFRLLILILITTLASYYAGITLEHTKSKKKKKVILLRTLLICLGILFVFKYLNFTCSSLCFLFNAIGIEASFEEFSILLPMGISFYTFQTLSYTIDVYRGNIPAERHFGYYSLFVVFFPQLVAGPIERPGNLLPQLKKSPSPSSDDISEGFRFLLTGYVKKILIADYFAGFVDIAYNHPAGVGGASLLLATILFAIQIYCDFSGYSDIALGCARFLGIRLSENFKNPYQAVSIRDFWKRWHISLTCWFTDYLYIPLGGNRKGTLRHYRNILITFLFSGLWHGANMTYLLWGIFHGLLQVAETFIQQKQKKVFYVPVVLRQAVTFSLVCFSWIFFRAATVSDAFSIIRKIITDFRIGLLFSDLALTATDLVLIPLLLILLRLLKRLPLLKNFGHTLSAFRAECQTALLYLSITLAVIICRCLILTEYGTTSFIYFQF